MFDSYKVGQPNVFYMLDSAIKGNRLSHAYLFDSNGNADVLDIVLSFVKEIVNIDNGGVDREIIDKRIDSGNYLDVKIIEPDGMWIKKEQMVDLQDEFSKKAIEGKKKIYIIKNADRMNLQTANSILKFLEEPVDDIIAILIVDNINLVLPTIISRCQIIKLNRKCYEDNAYDIFFDMIKVSRHFDMKEEDRKNIVNSVINFIKSLESNGTDTIIYVKKLWNSNFKDRDMSELALELIIQLYYDVIKYKANIDDLFFKDRLDIINIIDSNNNIGGIIKKLEILDEAKSDIRMNVNINLLVDRLIIDMCR